jgi:hypothetical protein
MRTRVEARWPARGQTVLVLRGIMSRRFHVLIAAVGLLIAACGSADTNGLSGGAAAGTGGQIAAGTGTGAATGASTGTGGATDSTAGTGGVSAGGTAASGASGGAGGDAGPIGAGSGGTRGADSGLPSRGGAPDSGAVPLDASAVVFVPGGIISAQCAACADANCRKEGAVCQAEPASTQVYKCVTSCIIPLQCAACLVGSGPGPQEFNSLECCTSRKCAGLCPSLNAGVLGCP